MAEAKRDSNFIPTLLAVSNADGSTPVTLYADPTTHRLLVSNGETFTSGTVSTTDATVTTLISLTLAANTAYHVRGILVGNETSDGARMSCNLDVTAYRAGAGAVIEGYTTSLHMVKSDATWGDPTFDVSSNALILTVTGKAATDIDWSGVLYYLSV